MAEQSKTLTSREGPAPSAEAAPHAGLAPRTGLVTVSALGGHDETVNGVRIRERVGLGIVSAAIPLGGADAFAAALNDGYGFDVPAVGRSFGDGATRAAMVQPGQLWLLYTDGAERALQAARDVFLEKAWLVDQSDAWAALQLSGDGDALRRTLERICMLDLTTFEDGAVTRTLMEHLGVVLLREGADYTLMSARSSAPSLLHAITLSARVANA